MKSPAAVLFDCDGVLVDSEILCVEVEIAHLAEQGLVYDRSEYMRRFLGLSMAAGQAAIDADARERLGRSLPETFHATLSSALRQSLWERLTPVEGCADAVAALALPKAVASSSGAVDLRRKLDMTGLLPAFDPHVYSADVVARAKPHPDVFLHAAQAIEIAPERCLVLEDSVNGVRAGQAAGMAVWGFVGGGHMDGAAADRLRAAGVDRLIETWEEAAVAFAAF